jgi:hypothetical protein
MNKYRFVGSAANVGPVKMERFGQAFNIDGALATQAIKAGVPLLTEQQFQELGFTAQQLKVWADPFMPLFEVPNDPAEANDKADFMRKRDAAHAKFHEVRQGLLESKPEAPAQPSKAASKNPNKE